MKQFVILAILALSLTAICQHKKDKSVHHAAMHAEHWLDKHVSATHEKPGHVHKGRSAEHAAKHASNWLDHHLNPPTHKRGKTAPH